MTDSIFGFPNFAIRVEAMSEALVWSARQSNQPKWQASKTKTKEKTQFKGFYLEGYNLLKKWYKKVVKIQKKIV